MGIVAQDSGVQMTPASDSPVLDREGARARVAAHLATKRPIEELGVERNRPGDCRDFAFVGMAPKRSSQLSWYRCSFCQTDRKFSAGRIVLSSDGLLRLIGNDCWNQHLDTNRYGQEAQDWRDYERKQRFNRIRERIGPIIAAVAEKVHGTLRESSDAMRFVEEMPRQLRDGAPLLLNRLEQARRSAGRLQVERVVRDYVAVERGRSERFLNQAETLHVVLGLDAALGPVPQLVTELKQALLPLYRAKHLILETQWEAISNARAAKAISSIQVDLQAAIRAISLSSSTIEQACDFLSPENIAGMVRWSSDPDCDLVLEDVSLTRLQDGFQFRSPKGVFEFRRPSRLMRGMLPDTDELRRTLDLS